MSENSVIAVSADYGTFNWRSNGSSPARTSNEARSQSKESPPPRTSEEPDPAPVVEANSPYRIRIDSETMRSITEVVDQVTGEVLFYLPSGYRPSQEAGPSLDRQSSRDDR